MLLLVSEGHVAQTKNISNQYLTQKKVMIQYLCHGQSDC